MAMQDTGVIPLGNSALLVAVVGNSVTHALDASNDAVAVFVALRGGKTVTHIGVPATAVTGTLPTYRASLQGITSRGTPDGTVLGGGSPASATFNGSTVTGAGYFWIALSNNYAVAANGVVAAVVIDYSSGTVDGSNFLTVRSAWASDGTNGKAISHPYIYHQTAGSWASAHSTRRVPAVCVRYSDGTVSPGLPSTGQTIQSYALNSSNPERGVKINRPYSFRLMGLMGLVWPTNDSADFNVKVYLGSSSSPTVNQAFDVSHHLDVADERIFLTHFDAVTVAANEDCYLVVAPSVNSQNVAYYRQDFADATERGRVWPGMHHVIGSGGSWTDQTSSMAQFSPLIDGVDAGAAGGLLLHPGMSGGLRG